MELGVICQSCGIEAPSKHVDFHQNIGMLVARQSSNFKGKLCKRCLHKQFWKMTGTTAVVGWFGTISLILTPCFILNNTFRYLAALGMPRVPKDAKIPVVDEVAAAKIDPYIGEVFARLNANEALATVARDVAGKCGATPGQIVKYTMMVAQSQQQQRQPPTHGFPVIQAPPVIQPPPLMQATQAPANMPSLPPQAGPMPIPAIPIEEEQTG